MSEPRDQSRAVQKHFSTDADTYDLRHYGIGHRTFYNDRQALVAALLRGMGLPAGAAVLDVACGPGHFLRDVASMGLRAYGIDASPDMIRASAARMGADARLVRGDGMSLPFADDAFDAVNCSGLIEYIPRPAPLIREILRVLKPGAQVMLSSTNKLSPALALGPLVTAMRRSGAIRRLLRSTGIPVEERSMKAREFEMTFHTPRGLAALFRAEGFQDVALHYYHLQLLPHPADRVMPRATGLLVKLTDPLLSVPPLRMFAEGLLAVGTKPRA